MGNATRRELIRNVALTGSVSLGASLTGCLGGGDGGGGGEDMTTDTPADETPDTPSASQVEQWRAEAEDEGPLTVASPVQSSTIQGWGDAINERYPFIEFKPIDLGPQQLETRYISEYESGQTSIDLVLSQAWTMIQNDMALDLTQLPNYQDVPDRAKYGDNWTAWILNTRKNFFNHNMVSREDVPESWENLVDGEYKGMFPLWSFGPDASFYKWGEENVDPDFMEKLAKLGGEVYEHHGICTKVVGQGGYPMTAYSNAKYPWVPGRAQGAPVTGFMPTLAEPASMIANPKAPNLSTVKWFMNWYFTEEAARIQIESITKECVGTVENFICDPEGLTELVQKEGDVINAANTVDYANLDWEAYGEKWSGLLEQYGGEPMAI